MAPSATRPKKKASFKIPIKTSLRSNFPNPRGPRSRNLAAQETNASREGCEGNAVIQSFREEQLGRNVFLTAVPLSTGLIAYHNRPDSLNPGGRLFIMAVSVAVTAIWNGMLVRKVWPWVSIALELTGVSLILLAYFGYLASHLPDDDVWLPTMCFVLTLPPVFIAAARYFRRENTTPEDGAKLQAASLESLNSCQIIVISDLDHKIKK